MTKSHKKMNAVCESRALRATLAATALWAALAAVSVAADDQPAPPADAALAKLTVTGFANDAISGKPIEGAKVTVHLLRASDAADDAAKTIEAVTDAQGKYTFDLPTDHPSTSATPVRSGRRGSFSSNQSTSAAGNFPIRIEVRHPQYARGSFSDTVPLEKPYQTNYTSGSRAGVMLISPWMNADDGSNERRLKSIELLPGKEVYGVLQSPEGKPAAGIKVTARSQSPKFERELIELARRQGSSVLRELSDHATDDSVTDAEGKFRLSMITPGEGAISIYPDNDFAPLYTDIYDRRGDLGIVKLQRGAKISGQVVDAEGKPLPKVQVSLTKWHTLDDAGPGILGGSWISRDAMTDANGKFTLAPVPSGEYRLEPQDHVVNGETDENGTRANNWHKLPGVFIPKKMTLVDGHDEPAVELRAEPTFSIEGHISDSMPPPGFSPGMRNPGFTVQGTLNGLTYRVQIVPEAGGDFKVQVPQGMKNTLFDLIPSFAGQGTPLQQPPQWRLGAEGPLQSTTKIHLGTLTKDFKDLEIVYGQLGDPNQPQPAAAGRARAAQPAGRAVRGGARGQAAPAPVPADTNDDSNSK